MRSDFLVKRNSRCGRSLATRSWTREGVRFVRSGQQFFAFQEPAHSRSRPQKSHRTLVLLSVQARTQHQNSGVREGFRAGNEAIGLVGDRHLCVSSPAFCGNHAPGRRLGSRWLGLLVAALWWRPDLRPCQRRSNVPWLFSATPRSGNPSRGSPRCGEGAGRRWVSGAGTTSQGCSVFCARNHPGT